MLSNNLPCIVYIGSSYQSLEKVCLMYYGDNIGPIRYCYDAIR